MILYCAAFQWEGLRGTTEDFKFLFFALGIVQRHTWYNSQHRQINSNLWHIVDSWMYFSKKFLFFSRAVTGSCRIWENQSSALGKHCSCPTAADRKRTDWSEVYFFPHSIPLNKNLFPSRISHWRRIWFKLFFLLPCAAKNPEAL